MPAANLRPCNHTRCGALVRDGRYCDRHRQSMDARQREERRARQKQADGKRGSSAARGYGYRWQKARREHLAREPICRECLKEGRTTAATVVDHIVPHRGDQALFWDRENWQALCKPCHDLKTARESDDNEPAARIPAWLKPSAVPLTIVCGPSGAGKTTLARGEAGQVDTVIDLDEIRAELSGLPKYGWQGDEWLRRAMRERNRRQWVELLRPARVVVLEVPLETCRQRLESDPTRPPPVSRFVDQAERWWTIYTPGTGEEVRRA